jgi:hypothetical protein
MTRGRPVHSVIRQNIVEILFFMQKGYGYEISKVYKGIFPQVTMRSIYYHLRKGVDLGEFKVQKVQMEKGDYSWGQMAEKTYYSLGKNAQPLGNKKVEQHLQKVSKDD